MLKKIFTRKLILKILNKINYFYKNLENIDIKEVNIINENILVLAPHPDDESIGCSGLMLKYPNKIKVVCLTDGRYGDSEISTQNMIRIREDEFKNAMNEAKIKDYQFLSIEDGTIKESFNDFCKINFKDFKHIFIPNYLDKHFDHKAVSHHVSSLIQNKKISNDTLIYYYEVWNTVPVVNSYINLSFNIDKKRQIIKKYSSQLKHIDYSEKIIGLNNFRGLSLGVEFAECYMKLTTKEFLQFMDSK